MKDLRNKHPAPCFTCRSVVPAGEGRLSKDRFARDDAGRWLVTCIDTEGCTKRLKAWMEKTTNATRSSGFKPGLGTAAIPKRLWRKPRKG